MDTFTASLSILKNTSILVYILKGTAFTLIISAVAVLVSIVLGSVLALIRNYCTSPQTKIFKWIATVYIEVFRNTPLLSCLLSMSFRVCPQDAWADICRDKASVQGSCGTDSVYFIHRSRNHPWRIELCSSRTV